MTDGVNDEYNIQDIKRLFFDPKCGGSKQCGEAVTKLVEGYRAAFQYLNAVLSADEQHEIASETDHAYWITPEQMERQVAAMLMHVHNDDESAQKFREAAAQMGIDIPLSGRATP